VRNALLGSDTWISELLGKVVLIIMLITGYLEPVCRVSMGKIEETGVEKILRIHGVRSRPIIHLERSASASPLEFAPGPASLPIRLQATSVVSDRAGAAQNRALDMRLYPF
jgi:hypothetical protein